MINLTLYNTLSQAKEEFTPLNSKLIKMYVCGPTVYDRPHLGNARSVVVYDVLFRLLQNIYGKSGVKYVRNITDVDDKIIMRALENQISIEQLTLKTTAEFHDDIAYLGCLPPTIEPKATEHINQMIEMIQKLINLNYAYEKNGEVFFAVDKFASYADLSQRNLSADNAGVRIELNLQKDHHADFLLWKPLKLNENYECGFDSPWGRGRPGWHIECSAMSYTHLGADFDIHGGGIDLIFPHHTNEVAQSVCALPGSKFARYWVHNGFLTVNSQKMSKSLGNFITVYDLINQQIPGNVIRLFMLMAHYRKPLDYNSQSIHQAQQIIQYWQNAICDIDIKPSLIHSDFLDTLHHDLNTPLALKIINDYAKLAHKSDIIQEKEQAASQIISACELLGIDLHVKDNNVELPPEIQILINQRNQAKLQKNWAQADEIRDKLQARGIVLEDQKDGSTKWQYR